MPSDLSETPRPLSVLLVEDDALIGLLLSEMLTAIGHSVCPVAETEADAVLAAAIYHPDLMIVDARLGDGSGVAAMAEILLTGPVPHIFMSGNLTPVRRARPDAVLLQKPFDEAALQRAMSSALGAQTPRGHAQPGLD